MRWLAFTGVVAFSLAARAQDLTPAKAAQIEHDQQKEYDKIDQKHGNKLPSEMSSDERRDIIHERAAAEQKIFDKQGVDAKDYTKYITKMPLDDRATMKDAAEKLEKKDEAEKEANEAQKTDPNAPKDPKDIPIQRGFNDQHPVTLEDKKNAGGIVVEHGLPPEAEADQAAASAGNGPAESSSEKRDDKKSKRKH